MADITQKITQWEAEVQQLTLHGTQISLAEAGLYDGKAAMVQATEERLRVEAELKYFKAANNIREEAKYPDSSFWHFGVLAICVLVEVVVNAFFYQNSEGLLGGVVVAFGIAAINLGSALMLGNYFRYKNLAATGWRVFGWTCLAGFAMEVVFCNSLFAAFRSEYQALADNSNRWPSTPRTI